MRQPVSPHTPHSHPAAPRRRRLRTVRFACLTAAACLAVGGTAFVLTRNAAVPSASAASAVSMPAASSSAAEAENSGLLSAAEAQAMLDDPRMILVNHTNPVPENYTVETKECGSASAANKNLQTEAADAFLAIRPLPPKRA